MFPPRFGPNVSPSTAPGTPQASQHLRRICPPSVLLRPLRQKKVLRRRKASECADPASDLNTALVMPTAHRELQVHLVLVGVVGATPALKTSSLGDLDGLPKGKEALRKPRAPGHVALGSDLNVNRKLRYPWRYMGVSCTNQGTATTLTTTEPTRPSGRSTSKEKQDTWLQKEPAKDCTRVGSLGETPEQIPGPSTPLHCHQLCYLQRNTLAARTESSTPSPGSEWITFGAEQRLRAKGVEDHLSQPSRRPRSLQAS